MRRFRGALVLAATLLGGCSDVPIPMKAPDPFSEVLLEYLHLPFVGRAEVMRWLGDPDASGLEGALSIYIEPRERARELPSNRSQVDVHYLLIEFDGQDRVSTYDEIVGAGCTASGLCIEAVNASGRVRGKPAEIKKQAARNLVIYRAGDVPRSVIGEAPSQDAASTERLSPIPVVNRADPVCGGQ